MHMPADPSRRPSVAIVGSGIAGLAAAYTLRDDARVTLFEAGDHFGGHAHTVDVTLGGVTHGVDTGFLVFNHRTYPGLTALFEELGVETAPSEMSFSVQVPRAFGVAPLEWAGTTLGSVFCQRANLARPRFWRMLNDLMRFNRLGTDIAESGLDPSQPLAAFLQAHGFGDEFRDWYLLPMIACIWSCPTEQMLAFPAATLLRFCHTHGLLQVTRRPQWYTVAGGSREYVKRIVAGVPDARLHAPVRRIWRKPHGVRIATDAGTEDFERVIVATHPRDALALMAEPTAREHELLGAIHYQRNRAVLHTDASVLPRHRSAWAAWNYESSGSGGRQRVCLHYLIDKLQPLPWSQPVIVSLNPLRPVPASEVIGEFEYEHPVFDARAIDAQAHLQELQGRGHTWFAGAWTRYGFHEDGLSSGVAAARGVLARPLTLASDSAQPELA
jgi:predicted NAD/FAD-binding protein